jgi:DNA-binding IclR family transcriptional regulator
MEELVRESRESAALVVRTGARASVVAKVDSPETIKVMPETGWSYPLHAGAAGKVMLAYMPRVERERYLARDLERVTKWTIVDPGDLEAQLEEVRAQGWSVIDQELIVGGVSLAAPVLDPEGSVAACMSLAGPRVRFTTRSATAAVPGLLDCAQRMSAELGATAGEAAST